MHPTEKPVALLEYLIRTYTNAGETVLDNCMGSGSCAVACIRSGRHYIGYELNEEYFKIAEDLVFEELRRNDILSLQNEMKRYEASEGNIELFKNKIKEFAGFVGGGKVYDIGLDLTRITRSPFYAIEAAVTAGYWNLIKMLF